jgi:hypothetical protein
MILMKSYVEHFLKLKEICLTWLWLNPKIKGNCIIQNTIWFNLIVQISEQPSPTNLAQINEGICLCNFIFLE